MNIRHDMIACYVVRLWNDAKSAEFLQLKRSQCDYLGETWQTVYGTAECDETLWQAALRELREETGLRASQFYRLPTVRSFYTAENDTVWHVAPFCAIVESDAVVTLNIEHTAFRWVSRSDATEAFMWPTDRDSVREVCSELLDSSLARAYLRIDLDGTGLAQS